MVERHRQPMARPVDQLSQEGGKDGGVGLTPKKAAPRPAARSKTFVRITTNYNTPPTLKWGAPTRGP